MEEVRRLQKQGLTAACVLAGIQVDEETMEALEKKSHGGFVYGAVSCRTSGLLAASVGHEEGGSYHEVVLYRADDLHELGSVFKLDGQVTLRCAFSQSGGQLAVGGEDGVLRLLELPLESPGTGVRLAGRPRLLLTSKPVDVAPNQPKEIKHLVFHPNNIHIIGSMTDGSWRVWQIRPDELVEESVFPATPGGPASAAGGVFLSCRCAHLSDGGTKMYTVHNVRRAPKSYGRAAVLTQWSLSDDVAIPQGAESRASPKLQLRPEKVVTISQDPVTALALSDDGKYGAVGNGEGQILVFRTSNLAVVARLKDAHGLPVTDLAFRPSSNGSDMLLVSVGADKTLRIYQPFPRRRVCRDFLILLMLLIFLFAVYRAWREYEEGNMPDSLETAYADWVQAFAPDYKSIH